MTPADRQRLIIHGFRAFRESNRTRCETYFHSVQEWSASDWMTAVAGEVGEAANIIKKLRRGDYKDEWQAREEIAMELADVVTYVDLLAARFSLDLGWAVVRKFNIVSERRNIPMFIGHPTLRPPAKPEPKVSARRPSRSS